MRPPAVVVLSILLGGSSLFATMSFALSEAQVTSNDADAIRDIFLFSASLGYLLLVIFPLQTLCAAMLLAGLLKRCWKKAEIPKPYFLTLLVMSIIIFGLLAFIVIGVVVFGIQIY